MSRMALPHQAVAAVSRRHATGYHGASFIEIRRPRFVSPARKLPFNTSLHALVASKTSPLTRNPAISKLSFSTSNTMASLNVDVKSLISKDGDSKDLESKLANILDQALNGDGKNAAESIATKIDELYASGYNTDEKAEDFLYTLWTFYINAAKKLNADDERQKLLVQAVQDLKEHKDRGTAKIWGEDRKVWGDVSMLGSCMRDAWNFAPEDDASDTEFEVWVSLTSFAARLLGQEITSWTNFAIWSLRSALEEEQTSSTSKTRAVKVAQQWIEHASAVLEKKSREVEELNEAEKRMLKPGKLFEGEPGFSEKRWAFWKQRLEELQQ